jgi:transcriptional regulator with XRE-family HTH domain
MESRTGPSVTDGVTGENELAGVTTRAELGSMLTNLRARSGRSLRDLAASVSSSASTLSGWCRAENLPFPSQHGVFRHLLEELGVDDPEPWVEALIRVRDGATPRGREGPAPYRGLDSFTYEDADWFFGRDALTDRAVEVVRELLVDADRPRLVVVVGASGSGKSSLLHAGLRPRLERVGRTCRSFSPGPDPLRRLAAVLHPDPDRPDVHEVRDDARAWVGSLARPHELDQLVVMVDQLEELFTVCDDEHERRRTLAALETLADPSLSRCLVIVALRIDLYAELATSGYLAEPLQSSQVLVGPMDTEQLVDAIVEPARGIGCSVDDDLVSVVLRDFLPTGTIGGRHPAGALPMLSYALLETWRRSRRGRITVADYHAAGGIAGAIEQAAEAAYTALTPQQQTIARDILLRLVRLSDDDALATRRAASFDELDGLGTPEPGARAAASVSAPPGSSTTGARRTADVDAVIDRFVGARLLTAHASTIELAHEALLAAWPRLATWIEEDRDALRVRRTIAEAARLWLDSGRDPSTLARGARLEAMRPWSEANDRPLLLSHAELEFLTASAAAADDAEAATRRRTRRLRMLVAATTSLALLAGVLAVIASAARTDAIAARDDALSRQVALTSDRLRDTNPGLAAQLAVVGHAIARTSEARSTLLDAVLAPHPARYLGGPGTTMTAVVPIDGGDDVVDGGREFLLAFILVPGLDAAMDAGADRLREWFDVCLLDAGLLGHDAHLRAMHKISHRQSSSSSISPSLLAFM